MDHLLGLGHRAIGIITGSLLSPISRYRLAGVRRSAANFGAADRTQVHHGDFSVQSGFQHNYSTRIVFRRKIDLALVPQSKAQRRLSGIRSRSRC